MMCSFNGKPRRRLSVDAIRGQASGRWLEIFQALCPGMFDEAIEEIGNHVTCPFHGGKEDFRFIKSSSRGNTAETGVAMCTCGYYADGFAVLVRATGLAFPEVLKQVDRYLNGDGYATANSWSALREPPLDPEAEAARREAIYQKMRKLWNGASKFDPAQTPYYCERGISPDTLEGLQCVRTLESLAYFHKEKGETVKLGRFPAILALLRARDGRPVSVHRTWLSHDRKQKGPVPKAKKLSASLDLMGSAIRLFDVRGSEVLGLAEGIETALAARELCARGYFEGLGAAPVPVWSCFAERNMRAFQVPEDLLPTLKKIIVFADNDGNGKGLEAAKALKENTGKAHPEIEVEIRLPPVVGEDWLDTLVGTK